MADQQCLCLMVTLMVTRVSAATTGANLSQCLTINGHHRPTRLQVMITSASLTLNPLHGQL